MCISKYVLLHVDSLVIWYINGISVFISVKYLFIYFILIIFFCDRLFLCIVIFYRLAFLFYNYFNFDYLLPSLFVIGQCHTQGPQWK